jgi:SSS family solute:Na+ symporter
MNVYIFWSALAGLAIASIGSGFKGRKSGQTIEDYFICRSSLKLGWLTLTILATQLGGGTVIGAAETAYSSGWVGCFYSLGIGVGLILMGLFIAPKLKSYTLMTMASVFGKVYKSPLIRKISAYLSVVTLFFILVAIGISCRKLFAYLGYDSPWALGGFWFVILGYTVLGGLRAVVITDTIQVIFILAVLAFVAVFVLGTPNLANSLVRYQMPENSNILWTDWVLMPLCFMIISQDMGQRCFAAIDKKTIQKAMLIAAASLMAISVVPVALGILGSQLGITVEGGSALMATVEYLFAPAVVSLIAIAIIIAIVSTADSLLCAISSNISVDILQNSSVLKSRMVTFIIGFIAMIFSYTKSDVIPVMIIGYEVSVFVLFIPFLMGLYKKDVTEKQAFYSMGIGTFFFLLKKVTPFWGIEFCMLMACLLPYLKRSRA